MQNCKKFEKCKKYEECKDNATEWCDKYKKCKKMSDYCKKCNKIYEDSKCYPEYAKTTNIWFALKVLSVIKHENIIWLVYIKLSDYFWLS